MGKEPRIVAVGGGKGGAGKSLLAANIGIFLATLGKRVTLVDAALGMANLHFLVGVSRPERTLSEALVKSGAPLDDLAISTPIPGLRLIAGARDPVWVATPKPGQVRRISAELRAIEADFVVVDLSPGTGNATLDLFLAADLPVLIAVPEPTSVELCYRSVRAAFFRHLRTTDLTDSTVMSAAELFEFPCGIPAPNDYYARALDRDPEMAAALKAQIAEFRPQLVINAARSKADMEMGQAMATAVRRQLGVPMNYLGHLEYDEAVWVAVRRRRPLLVEHPESRVSKCIEKVTRRLMAVRDGEGAGLESTLGDTYYDLLEVEPTASFEDIRRANRRIRELYGRESVVISGLYNDQQLDELHRQLDMAYSTLMDAARRKDYDTELFPGGVPFKQTAHPTVPGPTKVEEALPAERPPMPEITPTTDFTGPLLRQLREAQGIELREIAERTKIGMAYLHALESETFAKLPAAVYVRGFLVEYSKIVGIDADRVLDTYLTRYRAERIKLEAEQDDWP